ncbi:MAG: PepSY domain-containing protein, partial [Planctomycetaceae bacterium]|nr:PepSY domain-containing protein [Planctomycetaceae bacterium]
MLNFILFCSLVLIVVAICFWFRARNHGLWRRILYKTHLWLGIVSGIVLFVVCLSGALLVFHAEINTLFKHDQYSISPHDKLPFNLDDLIVPIEQNKNGKVSWIGIDNRNNKAYYVIMKVDNGKNAEGNQIFRDDFFHINQYTGEILAESPNPLDGFFHNIYLLHSRLFLPYPYGKIIVGSATLIFVVIALSGFCLWLPTNFRNLKAWTNGFLIRFRKRKNHLLYDLHKTLGFYALIPVLLMALTGLMWSFNWYSNGVRTIFNAHVKSLPIKSPPKHPDAKRLPLEFFAKKSDELIEQKGYRWFSIPEQEDNPIIVEEIWRVTLAEKWNKIQFDQYTGEVLKFERFDDLPIGSKFVSLYYELHVGKILGLPTKIIYFLACLFATTLPITG